MANCLLGCLLSLVLLLSLCICCIEAQTPVFFVQPVSINTTEGSVEVFTCTANGSSILSFLVNGDQATDPSVVSKKFMQSTEPIDGGFRRANLTVTASSSLNNNSVIKCRAVGSSITDSEEAILRVQGSLSSVVDLSYSFIDSSTVTISWSPPFTLPGTDITGYNISATSNGTTTNYFTSNTYYQLSLCVEVNVTVSGYNGLNGEESSPLSVPSAELKISIDVSITDDLDLIISTNFSDSCSDQTLVSVLITVSFESVQPLIVSVPTGTDIVDYNTNVTLNEDTIYTVTVSYSIYNGGYTVNGYTSIDTFGVESLSISDLLNGTISITCYFNSFSTDTVCKVELVQNEEVQYTAIFNRTGDIAHGTISGVFEGMYNIRAFDEGSSIVAASKDRVVVDGLPTPTPSIALSSTMMIMFTSVSTTSTSVTTSTSSSISMSPTEVATTSMDITTIIIIVVVVVVVVILILIVITIVIIYCCCKKTSKGYSNENKRNSSDGLVGSSSFTDRSPTNPPANIEDMYARPNKANKGHTPVVYAELSGFNKPHNNKVEPVSKQADQPVVYSDLMMKEDIPDHMIKGQPPPPPYEPVELRETRLHSSATVIRPSGPTTSGITKTIINHPNEDIQEIFFHHPENQMSDDEGSPPPPMDGSYPPAPTERAPSPPEDDPNRPPPIPSRHHGGGNRLPDVVRQHHDRQDSEDGFTDESMNPTMGVLTGKQDGMFMNTPAATYL